LAASQAIQSFIAILQKIPPATIAADHIGLVGPAQAGDMPLIAVSLLAAAESPIGIGGVAGIGFDGAQWTVSTGTRTTGQMQVDIWAANAAAMNQISGAISTLLAGASADLTNAGFVLFQTAATIPGTGMQLSGGGAGLHTALTFSIVHEDIASPVIGPGGEIHEVDVTIDSQFHETMTLK